MPRARALPVTWSGHTLELYGLACAWVTPVTGGWAWATTAGPSEGHSKAPLKTEGLARRALLRHIRSTLKSRGW